MSTEENKELVRQAIAEFNERKSIDDLFSPDYTIYVPFRGSDPEEPTESGDPPPYTIDVDDQIAEGDKVTTRWTIYIDSGAQDTGDHAAGTQRMASGITIDRVSGDKIVETWTSYNLSDFLHGQIQETWTNWTLFDPSSYERGRWPRRP
jgi:hypothetical protein